MSSGEAPHPCHHQQSGQRTRPALAEAPSRFAQSCRLLTLTRAVSFPALSFPERFVLCERNQPTGTLLCLASSVQQHVLRFVHAIAFIFKTAEEYLLCGHTVFCFYLLKDIWVAFSVWLSCTNLRRTLVREPFRG